mgnify:CR=1 FL=1|tara:strand:- start:695 stop:979 length:285 start_codon:yes stop_codon:yes gene_type:complete
MIDQSQEARRWVAPMMEKLWDSTHKLTMKERDTLATVLEVIAEKADQLYSVLAEFSDAEKPAVIRQLEESIGPLEGQEIAPGVVAYMMPEKKED